MRQVTVDLLDGEHRFELTHADICMYEREHRCALRRTDWSSVFETTQVLQFLLAREKKHAGITLKRAAELIPAGKTMKVASKLLELANLALLSDEEIETALARREEGGALPDLPSEGGEDAEEKKKASG